MKNEDVSPKRPKLLNEQERPFWTVASLVTYAMVCLGGGIVAYRIYVVRSRGGDPRETEWLLFLGLCLLPGLAVYVLRALLTGRTGTLQEMVAFKDEPVAFCAWLGLYGLWLVLDLGYLIYRLIRWLTN